MQKIKDTIYYSASDIVNFLECEHLTALDLINLETPLPQAEDDDEAILYQQKGIAHEEAYVDHLRNSVSCLADVSGYRDDLDAAVVATQEAMRAGADIIYQAALREGCFIGHADRKKLLFSLLLTIITGAFLIACSSGAKLQSLTSDAIILAFGDSLTLEPGPHVQRATRQSWSVWQVDGWLIPGFREK